MSVLLPGEREPDYGKVADLCHTLGYRDTNKPRPYQPLTMPLINFRKTFAKDHGLAVFPLRYDDPAVKNCAVGFLNANERLFKTKEHDARGPWLSKPEGKKLILETIAKLMCTQEMSFRRNGDAKRKQTDFVADTSESEMGTPRELETPQEVVQEETIHVKQPAQPKRAVEPTKPDAPGGRSIERHLQYTYPTEEVYPDEGAEWLFDDQSTDWPDREKAFAFRYFHERNLYTQSKLNGSQVKRFASTLQKRLGIENDKARDVIVRSRCKNLIKEISTNWGETGSAFLSRDANGAFVKSSQFEKAWKYYRNMWIKKVHGGNTDGVVELSQLPPSIQMENGPRKRLQDIEENPEYPAPLKNPEPSPKRARHANGEQISDALLRDMDKIQQMIAQKEPHSTPQPVNAAQDQEHLRVADTLLSTSQQPPKTLPTAMDVDTEIRPTGQESQSTAKESPPISAPHTQVKPAPKPNAQPSSEGSQQTAAVGKPSDKKASQPIPMEPANTIPSAQTQETPGHKVSTGSQTTNQTVVSERPVERRKSLSGSKEMTPNATLPQVEQTIGQNSKSPLPASKPATPSAAPASQVEQALEQQPQPNSKDPKESTAAKSRPQNNPDYALPKSTESSITPQLLVEQTQKPQDLLEGSTNDAQLKYEEDMRKWRSVPRNPQNLPPPHPLPPRAKQSVNVETHTLPKKPDNVVPPQPRVEPLANPQNPDPPRGHYNMPTIPKQTVNVQDKIDHIVSQVSMPQHPPAASPQVGQAATFEPVQFEPRSHPKAPAFTPVNVVPSNGLSGNMQYHASKMPTSSRPLERESGPSNNTGKSQRGRNSLPANHTHTSNGDHNGNLDLPNHPADWDSSRLARSKSSSGLGRPESFQSGAAVPVSNRSPVPSEYGPPPPPPSASRPPQPPVEYGPHPPVSSSRPPPPPLTEHGPPPPPPSSNAGPRTYVRQNRNSPVPASNGASGRNTKQAQTMTNPMAQHNSGPQPPLPIMQQFQQMKPMQYQYQNHAQYQPNPPPQPSGPFHYPSENFGTSSNPQSRSMSQVPPTPQNQTHFSTTNSPTESKPSPSMYQKPLSTPRHTATPEPSSTTPTSSSTISSNLTIILENTNQSPDLDSPPIPLSDFRVLSFPSFFELFHQRSGRDRTKTKYLIFKYNWGKRDSFTIDTANGFVNEEEWNLVKKRIRDTYFAAEDRSRIGKRRSGFGMNHGESGNGGEGKKKKKEWQVWVMGPDEEEEDEEEW